MSTTNRHAANTTAETYPMLPGATSSVSGPRLTGLNGKAAV